MINRDIINNPQESYIAALIFVLLSNVLTAFYSPGFYTIFLFIIATFIFLFPCYYESFLKKSILPYLITIILFITGWYWMLYVLDESTKVNIAMVLSPLSLIFVSILLFFRLKCLSIPTLNFQQLKLDEKFPPLKIPYVLLFILASLNIVFLIVVPRLEYKFLYAFLWLGLIIFTSMFFLISDIFNNNKWFKPDKTFLTGLLFLIIILIVAFSLYLNDLTSWKYSMIGDEYIFFLNTLNIVAGQKLSIFSFIGVYKEHPLFASYLEAIFLKIWGSTLWSWHLAYATYAMISLIALYYFVKSFSDNITALIATCLLGFSHYYIIFAHITKDYSTGLVMILLSLAFFMMAIKNKSSFLMYFSGVFTGLCFYVHYIARGSVLIIIVFILLLVSSKLYWNYLLPGLFGLFSTIQIFNPEQIRLTNNAFGGTLFTKAENLKYLSSDPLLYSQKIMQNAFINLSESLKAIFNFSGVDHFVQGSLLDIITASGLILGLITLIYWSFKRNKLAIAILIISFIYLILTVVIHRFDQGPALTRFYFLLPFIAIISAIGINCFIQSLSIPQKTKIFLTITLIILVLSANIYRIYYINENKNYCSYYPATFIIKTLQIFPKQRYYIVLDNTKELKERLELFIKYIPELKDTKLLINPDKAIVESEKFPVDEAIIITTKPEKLEDFKKINITKDYYYRIIKAANLEEDWLKVYIPKKCYKSLEISNIKTQGYGL